jgi:hypothetical protein
MRAHAETGPEEQARINRYLAATPDEQAYMRVLADFDFHHALAEAGVIGGNEERYKEHSSAMIALAEAYPEAHRDWLRLSLSE